MSWNKSSDYNYMHGATIKKYYLFIYLLHDLSLNL
jgi:hypothetical protein